MANIRKYHPGVYLKDSLEAMEMTSKEFAVRTGITERTLSSIITGKGNITFDIAYKLATYFDNSISFWTNLQNDYDFYLKQEEEKDLKEKEWELIKGVKSYLLANNYIEKSDNKEQIINKARTLSNVNNLTLLEKKDAFICLKEHNDKKINYFNQNFWISIAFNNARKQEKVNFDKKKLLKSIIDIRDMTLTEPCVFLPRLEKIFSDCGVSFILLPYLSNSKIYGVTKWFNKDNVMLALSNRSGKADLFWFTLFHEISHVLMEHKREILFNNEDNDDKEANQMASEMLIPKAKWAEFISRNIFTEDSIIQFAEELHILPCIILGRLHKEMLDKIPYGVLDKKINKSYTFD